MLKAVGASSLDQLIDEAIPTSIRLKTPLQLPPAESESAYLARLRTIAKKNKVFRSFIGLGYNDTLTPSVIRRMVFENPGWYTPYTPYQAEIAQGRLESLLNFQTMVSDLTGMAMANAPAGRGTRPARHGAAAPRAGQEAPQCHRHVPRVRSLLPTDDRCAGSRRNRSALRSKSSAATR